MNVRLQVSSAETNVPSNPSATLQFSAGEALLLLLLSVFVAVKVQHPTAKPYNAG
jgi:hypothetical protein